MPSKPDPYYADLQELILKALADESAKSQLESFLSERSNLPGPRMNTALVGSFARVIGQIVISPDPPVEQLENLLDGWAALSLEAAPVNQPREILPAAAVRSYGQVAVSRPDWWEDEIAKIHRAASNPRWRTREILATALQQMLVADWARTYVALQSWLTEADPLVIRAAAAAIAEPPLLKTPAQGQAALAIQVAAIEWFVALPPERRRTTEAEILRKALGYTLSVAIAAAPASGLALLENLATSSDKDIEWIVRENLKKNRLKNLKIPHK